MAKYPESVYPWYLIDILTFWTLNLFIIFVLKPSFSPFLNISLLDIFIFGLAVYTTANMTANAEVTRVLRAPFVDLVKQKNGYLEEVPKEGGFKGFFGRLIYCPRCTGLWWAAFLTNAYLFYPLQIRVLIIIFALSGLERFFTAFIGFIQKLERD